jgi:cytochrome d ubiquinol oxidase subunit II
MIFAVVLLFTAFPHAFAVMMTALHLPLLVALFGIVLRGTAFTFRAYGMEPDAIRAGWGQVFAWSSLVTPIVLGMVLGALSSGEIRVVEGVVSTGFLAGWLGSYALLVGLFALVLFALLAAVYMTLETEGELREDFRARALISEIVAGGLAAAVAWRASVEAPELFEGLVGAGWSIPVQVLTALAAATTLGALWTRRFGLARVSVMVQVSLVVLGWGLAMNGHLILPDMPVSAAGSRPEVLGPLAIVLGVGTVVLAPALWFLFRVFKGEREERGNQESDSRSVTRTK